MMKDSWMKIRDAILKHCKIVFPVLVVVVVALTVVIALNANRARNHAGDQSSDSQEQSSEESTVPPEIMALEVLPMAVCEDEEIRTFVGAYITAIGQGDIDYLTAVCDELPLEEEVKIRELAKYTDNNELLEVYTKQGYTEDSVIAFAYYTSCLTNYMDIAVPGYEALYLDRDAEGQLYIRKNGGNYTDEENEYLTAVLEQVDVVDFNNRVNTEYNELVEPNEELVQYMRVLHDHLDQCVGEAYAELYAQEGQDGQAGQGTGGDDPQVGTEQPPQSDPVQTGPQYATATTTVNVRGSDSEKADKLGKVSRGSRVRVQEVGVNGWTKILYEGKDGYIMSKYLQLEESAEGLEVIGMVTATVNINVRAAADQNSARLGGLPGGGSLELLGEENGWCKVKFNGQIGYVKSEYVTKQ